MSWQFSGGGSSSGSAVQPAGAYFHAYTYNLNSFQSTTNVSAGKKGANVLQFILMHVPDSWVITKIRFRCDNPAVEQVMWGFFDINKNLVGDTGFWSCNVNAGGGTLATPITLTPGWYYLAWTCDTTNAGGTTMPCLILQPLDASDNEFNLDQTRWGTAQNAASGGHMPSSLGTLTAGNGATGPVNCMFIA